MKDSPDEFLPLIAEFNKSLAKHGLYLSLVHTEEKSDWSETLKSLKIEEEVQKFQRYNEMPEVFEAAQSTFFDDDRDIWKNLAKKFAFAKSYKILEKQKKSQIQSDAISMGGLTLQLFENEQEGAILFNSENTPLSILKEVPQWDTSNPYYKLVKSAGDQSNLVQKWEQEVKEGEEIRRGELITLSHLGKQAKLRTGTDKLGVLKIDVDNLGNHFVGCKSQKAYQELSMRFDKFFGNDLKELWEGGDFCCKQGHVHTFKDNILIKTVAKHPSHKDVVVII